MSKHAISSPAPNADRRRRQTHQPCNIVVVVVVVVVVAATVGLLAMALRIGIGLVKWRKPRNAVAQKTASAAFQLHRQLHVISSSLPKSFVLHAVSARKTNNFALRLNV